MYSDDVWGRSGPHATIDITEPVKRDRIRTVDEIKRALEIAEVVPFRYLIQHVGTLETEFEDRVVEAAFSSLDEIRAFAGQRGVEVLLENIPNGFSRAARLNDFLAQTHLNLNYCFDAGHAHMAGDVEGEFELMKDRIRSTHLHDNNGQNDEHLLPGKGSIEWKRIMPLFAARQEQFPLLLELKEQADMEQPIMLARRAMDEIVELTEARDER
jgi:sugar phosphate isomerase/epimerase